MRLQIMWLPVLVCFLLLCNTCEARRVRVRPARPIEQDEQYDNQEEIDNDDNTPQPAVQYYSAEPRPQNQRAQSVVVSSDGDYNGLYGQQNQRQRNDYNRPATITRSQTPIPRTKEQNSRAPPVQTIRNYSKVNDDGSFTFGYEAADGSFKEETRGTDCVVRGKYGYVDPDGNKREFTYVSGNPCDPNNPDETQDEQDRSDEDSNEPENIPQNFQNYPKRLPVRSQTVRPLPTSTTARPPTTVFQNTYSHSSLPEEISEEEEEEEEEPIQYIQQQRQRVTNRPFVQTTFAPTQNEVNIRQRQRVITTPSPAAYHTSAQPVSITPRPAYRPPLQTLQTQPPATTYRPQLQIVTQKPAVVYNKPVVTTPNSIVRQEPTKNSYSNIPKGSIDFAAEFQKFQQEHNIPSTTSSSSTPSKSIKSSGHKTNNPIYESQLVYDPSTGQYDSALYQQLPQTDGDFSLSQRIQPYVHQVQPQVPHLVSLDQLQQQSPLYQRQQQQPRPLPVQVPQFSQQVYQKQQENLQVVNSQQLFAQQQELQQAQLHQDRVEAAKRTPVQPNQSHRFQVQQPQTVSRPQSFYYIQPSGQSTGQIDAFFRGHNIEY